MMKRKTWNFLVYVHAVLLLWAALFLCSLYLPDGGKAASILAIGMFFFLFVDIPLAVFSFVLMAKGRFDTPYKEPILILAILNFCVGISAWVFAALVLQMP